MYSEKITKAVDSICKAQGYSQESYDKVCDMLPQAISKAQLLSEEQISKIKEELGKERLTEICKILSEIK